MNDRPKDKRRRRDSHVKTDIDRQLEAETQRAPGFRTPPCPLHFGIGYNLECMDCRAMPTIMPNGELRDSFRAATLPYHRRWAEAERARHAEAAK